jgi:hypothetical protein
MKGREEPEAVQVEGCSLSRAAGKVKVDVTLSNQGSRPLFAISGLRRIEVDPDTGTLRLWFSDHGRTEGARDRLRRELTVPKTVAVEAGGKTTLSAELPEDMTRLVPHDDGTFTLEAVDLSKVSRAVAHVAVGNVPFYHNPSRGDFLEQLVEWGVDIEAVAEPTEPPACDAAAEDKP